MLRKKTKIIATIGPASNNDEVLEKMILGGMNIARLNFSHGDHKSHGELIDLIRRVASKTGRHIGIMLDTKGPEIRLGDFVEKGVEIEKDDEFIITTEKVLGTKSKFSISFASIIDEVSVDDILKIDDGEFICKVKAVDIVKRELLAVALNSHFVKSRKGVNIPGVKLSLPYLSEADIADITFGCEADVDFIAASFVRNKNDIHDLRGILSKNNRPNLPIIAKIENKEGIKNLNEILAVCDGIMVARGDMGVEINVSEVPFIQKEIIEKCRLLGKPVIVATQMLNSMQTNLIPTRAEVSDVSLAIAQGCDCVMLSGESASGKYPVESVEMQTEIAIQTEKHLDHKLLASQSIASSDKTLSDAMMNAIATTAYLAEAKLIVCLNCDGLGVQNLAKARPSCSILCITDSVHVARRISIICGVVPRVEKNIPIKRLSHDKIDLLARTFAAEFKSKKGDKVVVVGSVEREEGNFDLMRVIEIE